MKILIIRLSAMGDTIHTLPVAATFKRNLPGAELSWLVEPLSEPLLRNNPAIDKVYVLRKQQWLKSLLTTTGGRRSGACEAWKLVQDLRAQEFDIALDLQGLFKSAIFLSLSNARRKIGLSDTREGARLFIKEVVDVGDWFSADVHIVDRSLTVANYVIETITHSKAHTNVVEFPLPPPPVKSVQLAQGVWSSRRSDSQPYRVVVIAGGTWPTKLWAPQNWCELMVQMSKRNPLELCLIGSSRENDTNSYIESVLTTQVPKIKVTNLTGQTELLDLTAIFESSDLVVGADTGPLHLAAATGHPVVVGVYGSTPRVRNGPYGAQCHTVALDLWCQPCSSKKCPLGTTACLKELPVDAVLQAVDQAVQSRV